MGIMKSITVHLGLQMCFKTGGSNPAYILWLGGSALKLESLVKKRLGMKRILEWPMLVLLSWSCVIDFLFCALSSHGSLPCCLCVGE